MKLQKRDLIATCLVAVAAVVYATWAMGAMPSSLDTVRVSGAIVLALGFAASATAVVPTFGQLMHGNRAYLALTSVLGVVALVAGVMMLVGSSGAALTAVMVAMLALWLISTVHHSQLAKNRPVQSTADQPRADRSRVSV